MEKTNVSSRLNLADLGIRLSDACYPCRLSCSGIELGVSGLQGALPSSLNVPPKNYGHWIFICDPKPRIVIQDGCQLGTTIQ
jgi:hypothetical protein